jgi:hypothetical protein
VPKSKPPKKKPLKIDWGDRITYYTKEELEEFHKQKIKELQEKFDENERRFVHSLDSNNRTTQMSEDKYLSKMIADYEDFHRRKKSGKTHTEFSPEY